MANDLTLRLRLMLADNGVAGKLARAIASIAGLRKETSALAADSRDAMMSLREGVDSISRQISYIERAARGVFLIFQGAGIAGGIIRTAAEFESLEAAMRAVFGSSDAVRRELDGLREMSDRLGLPLETLSRQWLSFAAAARGTAMEGDAAREAFTSIAEAATVLGMSSTQLEGALLAVQQMISKGTVSSEELRQQLGERLYGAVQVAARSIGLTSQAFNDLLERGMLPVEKFLPAFARQLRQEFGQSAQDSANTARAAFARLQNALLDLQLEFARSGFMDAIVDAARQLTNAFKDAQFRQAVREFGQLIGNLTRFIVEHGDKLVVLGGVIAGARTGAATGRLFGPKGAIIGAGVGAIAGGAGAASILPDDTASGRDERRVMDVEAAVARLQRRIEETRRAAAAGLIKPDEAARRIADDSARIERLLAKPAPQAPAGADAMVGPALQWQAMVDKYRSANDRLDQEIARARALGKALGKPAAEIEAMVAKIRATAKSSGAAPRLPRLIESFDAELAALKAGLKTAEDTLDAAFRARLVKEENYWQAKGEMQRRALDIEAQDLQRQMADQQRLIDELAKARPKDANQRQEIEERLQQAKNKLAELQIKMGEIDGRRMVVDLEVRSNLDRARQELEDLKAGLRERIAEATGEMTPEMRRAAIERANRDLLARLAAESDADGVSLIDRLIDVKAAQANLAALEAAWRQITERLRNAQEAIQIQTQAGLLTEAQARQQIVALQQQSAAEMQRLLPAMQQAAQAIGPEAVIRVQAWRNELERTWLVTDELAPLWNRIGEGFGQAVQGMASGAQSLREGLSNIFRSISEAFLQHLVIQPFQQWVAMQAKMLAMKLGFAQQQAAIEQAAAAQSVATKQAETAAKVSANAAEAGSGAAASQAAIPVVGPGLALAAMAAMVAAVMALMGKVKRFAVGGYVSGPGTSTSDSIPARLSSGEYVVRAAAVRRVGVAFLDTLNGLKAPPAWDGQRLALAAGGLVPQVQVPPAQPQVQQAVRIVNAIDPGVTHDHLQTPAGERVILNIIGRNASAVRAALA